MDSDPIVAAKRKRLIKAGWIDFKAWLYQESDRTKAAASQVRYHVWKGDYPKLKIRRLNSRVILVKS